MGERKVTPITPAEATAAKASVTPAEIFDAFNGLLIERSNHGEIKIDQEEVIAIIIQKLSQAGEDPTLIRKRIFDKHWLDIEECYSQFGWSVKYDKPGYNEDYAPFWLFKAKDSQ